MQCIPQKDVNEPNKKKKEVQQHKNANLLLKIEKRRIHHLHSSSFAVSSGSSDLVSSLSFARLSFAAALASSTALCTSGKISSSSVRVPQALMT